MAGDEEETQINDIRNNDLSGKETEESSCDINNFTDLDSVTYMNKTKLEKNCLKTAELKSLKRKTVSFK